MHLHLSRATAAPESGLSSGTHLPAPVQLEQRESPMPLRSNSEPDATCVTHWCLPAPSYTHGCPRRQGEHQKTGREVGKKWFTADGFTLCITCGCYLVAFGRSPRRCGGTDREWCLLVAIGWCWRKKVVKGERKNVPFVQSGLSSSDTVFAYQRRLYLVLEQFSVESSVDELDRMKCFRCECFA